MTSDERRDAPDSLADQAAAWVPPWARQTGAPPEEQPAKDPIEPVEPAATESEQSPAGSDPASVRSDSADQVSAGSDPGPVGAAEPVPVDSRGRPRPRPPVEPKDAGRTTGPVTAVVPAPEPPALIDDDELRGALEAILLVVDEPVAEIVLAQVLEQPTDRVAAMLGRLSGDYTAAGHGFELRRAAGGWRLYTRPEYATYVERFVLNGQAVRLTQAALETLAVVAYKQPVTRSRISAIRGVNCDGVIRTLVSRGLVEECGTEPDSGAFLYRTTTLFLEKLGLNTVDELPPLAPFLPDDLEEIADAPR